MSLHTEFDKGSLIWVKGEIEETFGRAKASLLSFAAGNDDAALKHAQTHLHQACGALTLVDLSGLARFCEEIEQTIIQLSRREIGGESVPVMLHGIESACAYLDRLMAGMSNTPLLLLPVFREMAALRGASQSGAELFFPQLQLDLPDGLPQKTMPADELGAFIRKQRSRFESGLLRLLQGQPSAAQAMASSLSEVATYQQVAVVRAFWWTAAVLTLGLSTNRAELDLDSRQLMLRLNLQMRRLADGSSKVAERLFRDMLYVLAKIDCDSNLVHRVQNAFELASLIPSPEAMALGMEQGSLQLARGLREDIRVVKDAWSRIASGQHDRLSQFPHQLANMAKKTAPLGSPALDKLWHCLEDALVRYGAAGPGEVDSLEFATGLLLADNALAVFPDLSADYANQVDALEVRLLNPSAAIDLPQLDRVSREAQERLLMAQIAQEIRINLQLIEETLDAYFRDSTNRSGLAGLSAPLRQVQGALLMLDRPHAVQILQECQKRIEVFIEGAEPEPSELEDLAEALSMLGFYIDDLEQGREKAETLQPALVKLCGFVDAVDTSPAMSEVLEVEPEIAEPAKVEPVSEPLPEPEPINKAQPISEAAIDAELLEVYLEEAVEVLASVAEQLQICRADPYDREAFTLIRRSFHTLKGSGRMVGLFNLGEVAWAVEQSLNKLLQAEKPASNALLVMIGDAHDAFSAWVDELQSKGTVEVEASALIARAEALRDGPEPEQEADQEITLAVEEVSSEPASEAGSVGSVADIVIGEVCVSATLFAIFREEAERHLIALQHGVALLAEQGIVEQRFILAAHTLGGIVSTTGFRRQGELAYALEHALQQLGVEAEREVLLLSEAVATLENMLTAVFDCAMPAEAPDLVMRLEELRAEVTALELDEDAAEVAIDLDSDTPDELALEVIEDLAPASQPEPSTSVELNEPDLSLDDISLELGDDVVDAILPPDLPVMEVPEAIETFSGFAELTLDVPEFGAETETETETETEAEAEAGIAEETTEAVSVTAVNFLPDLLLPRNDDLTLDTLEECPEVAEEPAAVQALVAIEVDMAAVALPEDVPSMQEETVEQMAHVVQPAGDLVFELETLAVAADISEEEQSLAVRKAEVDSSFIDDIDEQLLPVFIEEADELMPTISAQLHALADGEAGEAPLNQLKRTLHTMKGSARMSGAMRMGEAAHRMESRMENVTQPSEALLNQLDNDYDLLQMLFDEVSGRAAPMPVKVTEELSGNVLLAGAETIAPAQVARVLALAEPEGKATIRVKSDLVDELVNQAGEVSIARSRIEAEMLGLKGSLTDLTENVSRLRSQLREIEIQAESQMMAREKELQEHEAHFDPLEFDRFTRLQELTRFLAESVNDVGNVQQTLLKNLDESNAALLAQSRMTRDLQQSLMRVRLVPFNSVSERLYRLARTTGKEVGKKVNLELKGGSVEIDRGVLDKMASPFEHMLRNAIDHGLEDTATRLAAGKSEFGEILIEARQEGNELVLVLKDDGRGLDLARIRAKAIEKGMIQPDQPLSDHELSMLIFEPGFSTASNVTQLSGRGIGMDVVKNELGNLGGRIDLVSKVGEGTAFTIRLPLTLAVTQVLLVRAGERVIAIPSALVEQVQELKHEPLAELYAKRAQEWMGKHYPFAYLPRLLGDLYRQPEQKRYSMILLLRSGAERMALHIDSLVKNLEVVVKQVGPQLARVPGVVGGTVLGSGEIVLIMNPLLLLPMIDQIAAAVDPAQQTLSIAVQEKVEALQTTPVVMVVDDSLTVRKITGRLLAREGFQVVTAKDGVDALQQLQDVRPAVMLVDIEMPRMDGFELTRNVRAAPDTRGIPIIMITSRTADKHRNVAFDLGVNVFLGKPYQEDELLGHIRKFIDAS